MYYENGYLYGEDSRGEFRQQIDIQTGELIGEREYRPHIYLKPGEYALKIDATKKRRKQHFIKYFDDITLPLIESDRISTYECGVLLKLLHLVDWESNFLVHPKTGQIMNTKEISEYLHIKRDQLDKVMYSLCELGIIKIIGDKGYRKMYILNPDCALRGKQLKDDNIRKLFNKRNDEYR